MYLMEKDTEDLNRKRLKIRQLIHGTRQNVVTLNESLILFTNTTNTLRKAKGPELNYCLMLKKENKIAYKKLHDE